MDSDDPKIDELLPGFTAQSPEDMQIVDEMQRLVMQNPHTVSLGFLHKVEGRLHLGVMPESIWDENMDPGVAMARTAAILLTQGPPKLEGEYLGMMYTGLQSRIAMEHPAYGQLAEKLHAGTPLTDEEQDLFDTVSLGIMVTPAMKVYEICVLHQGEDFECLPASVVDMQYGLDVRSATGEDGMAGGPFLELMHKLSGVVGKYA